MSQGEEQHIRDGFLASRRTQPVGLPELTNKDGEMLDPTDGIVLSKWLKAAGLRCASSADLNLSPKTIERRGFDLWLGTVWVLEHAAFPIVATVISSIIRSVALIEIPRDPRCRVWPWQIEGNRIEGIRIIGINKADDF
jgi:hypothetical protein